MNGFARFVAILGLVSCVSSHGVLTNPKTRNDYLAYNDPGKNYNDGNPVSIPWPKIDNTFVCRDHDTPSKTSEYFAITAGQTLNVEWQNAHPGDIFFYITYDGDKPNTEKNWFKISNYTQTYGAPTSGTIKIPDYLPTTAHAILRWEMYALHMQSQNIIELYASCTDISITGTTGTTLPTPQVKIPGHLPLDASKYRAVDATSGSGFFFTGPAVATMGGAQPPSTPSTPPTTPTSPTSPTTPTPTTPGTTPAPSSTPTTPSNCAIGSKGCSCTPGGACDAGLACVDQYCLASSGDALANSGEVAMVSMTLIAAAALF